MTTVRIELYDSVPISGEIVQTELFAEKAAGGLLIFETQVRANFSPPTAGDPVLIIETRDGQQAIRPFENDYDGNTVYQLPDFFAARTAEVIFKFTHQGQLIAESKAPIKLLGAIEFRGGEIDPKSFTNWTQRTDDDFRFVPNEDGEFDLYVRRYVADTKDPQMLYANRNLLLRRESPVRVGILRLKTKRVYPFDANRLNCDVFARRARTHDDSVIESVHKTITDADLQALTRLVVYESVKPHFAVWQIFSPESSIEEIRNFCLNPVLS
ncbi:MAG TPA: hypothetical protein V6C81_21290 [Planktothrix sp.]|jgi:hypothetical protein